MYILMLDHRNVPAPYFYLAILVIELPIFVAHFYSLYSFCATLTFQDVFSNS